MARRRDSKGRFKRGGGTKRRRRKRGKGMGSIITVRRAGMGQLDADTLLPAAMGGGLSALTALSLRFFVDPAQGTTQQMLVKYAPWFGLAAGSLAAGALFMMGGAGGQEQATRAFISAAVVTLFGAGSDYVLSEKPGLAATISAPAAMAGYLGYGGMGAIVPEYSQPTGAIVMEPVGPGGQRAGTIGGVGSYGETVNLAGVNTSAFGTPGFNA